MTRLKTHYRAVRLLIAVMTLGMMFLPGAAFAQDTSSTTSSTMATGGDSGTTEPTTTITELPLLGSNITIELTTTDDGALASVTVDGEPAAFELEMDDDEIKIEFVLTNANGTFQVEVKFEDGDRKIEVETEGPATPGDFVWAGEACAGGAISVGYTVTEDGSLVLGAVSGDVDDLEFGDSEIEVEFTDGTKVEIELEDDELSIEQKCDDDDSDDHDSDDDSDDNDSDDDSDDHDSDDDSDDNDSDDDSDDDDDDDDDDDSDDDDDDNESDDDDDDDDEDDDE